jgi:hypothetical protein
MDGSWLTYQDLGVRLGVTPEAAKRRATSQMGSHPRQ